MTAAEHENHPDLSEWIGREEVRKDTISATACDALLATLHNDSAHLVAGDAAPLLSQWLHFWDVVPLNQTGEDGHPRRGSFLPPVALPRRMWAGSTLTFHRPLLVGSEVERRSTIASVEEKQGRTGRLVFVCVEHVVSDAQGPVLTDRHDIVYRDAPDASAPPPPPKRAPTSAQWVRRIDPDPVLLFRYSALTFNGHRIHYDRSYCADIEGYPGLVVHGPMIATFLLHELQRRHPDVVVTGFEFRAVKPIFDIDSFEVGGSLTDHGAELFARDLDGNLCMTATATTARQEAR